jgi:trigger factor
MQTDVTEAGPFERMLTVRIDEPELEDAKNRASRKLSRDLKIKGFRPGKAPRAVVERMVGSDRLRSEAIDEALPEVVAGAIEEAALEPVTTPRIEAINDVADGAVEIEVRITLWPSAETLPDYSDREITVDVPGIEDGELEDQIDRLRNQFAELEPVERAGDEGDFMLVNITAEDGGREIEEASASDLLYEVGSRSFIPGLDELLVGASAGDIREGPARLPDGFGDSAGEEVKLRVLVKGVRAKKLPEVTDEWVGDVSEFESVTELEEALTENLSAMKVMSARGMFQDELIEHLTEELVVELPEALVQAEMEASVHNLYHSLESQGIDLANYFRITGQSEEEFSDQLRDRADRALKTRVLLEGVAAAEGIEVADDELAEAVDSLAGSAGRPVDEVRSALQSSGQDQALAGDILRRKALDLLISRARPVDADGNEVDLTPPTLEDEEESSEEEPEGLAEENDTAE